MKGTYHSALGMVSTLAGAIEANKKMMQQVETSKQKAALAIEHAFGQLMETLEERKKALLAELEATRRKKSALQRAIMRCDALKTLTLKRGCE